MLLSMPCKVAWLSAFGSSLSPSDGESPAPYITTFDQTRTDVVGCPVSADKSCCSLCPVQCLHLNSPSCSPMHAAHGCCQLLLAQRLRSQTDLRKYFGSM